jgi:hypothetical protein
MGSHSRDALQAWFLGPRAENAEVLERLITEALRDHVFWRRNYHPEDGFTIRETEKRREGYEDAVATLTQELLGLLAALKRDVPFFSGRYKGHMVFEQTIASQVGYFAAMLYNPNNVASEISPVTTRLEVEVAAELGRMIGSGSQLGASDVRRHDRELRGTLARAARALPPHRDGGRRRRARSRASDPPGGWFPGHYHRVAALGAAQYPTGRGARRLG